MIANLKLFLKCEKIKSYVIFDLIGQPILNLDVSKYPPYSHWVKAIMQ